MIPLGYLSPRQMEINSLILPSGPAIFHYPFKNKVLNPELIDKQVIDTFSEQGIKSIFITAPSWNLKTDEEKRYREFIDYANSKGILLYGLTLQDATYLLRYDFLNYCTSFFDLIIQRYSKYNFKGFVIDIEPHTLADWQSQQEFYLKKLSALSINLHKIARTRNTTFSLCVPYWYNKIILNFDNRGINIFSCDFLVLMVYLNRIDVILNKVIQLANDLNSPLTVAVNINQVSSSPYISLNDLKKLTMEFTYLQKKYDKIIALVIFKGETLLSEK